MNKAIFLSKETAGRVLIRQCKSFGLSVDKIVRGEIRPYVKRGERIGFVVHHPKIGYLMEDA